MLDVLPRRFALVAALAALAGCDAGGPGAAEPIDLSAPWVEASPADVGIDPAAVAAAVAAARAIPRFRSLIVARDGKLVAEAYLHGADRAELQDVRSVTKSVVGLLAGVAIERGHLSRATRLADVLAGHPALRPEHDAITVEHLLTMTAGFEWDELGSDDYARWIRSGDAVGFLLARPLATAPGEAFRYNSAAVHLLGAVVAEAVGEPLPAFAASALFGPLGIAEVRWEPASHGGVNGGAGLDLRARDLARLGQLVLQGGRSGAQEVVPEAWLRTSTAPTQSWRAEIGPLREYTYGRLWWVTEAAPRAAFAWGHGGQFVFVVPEHALVVTTTTDWRGVSAEPGGARALEAAVLEVVLGLLRDGL